MKTVLITGGAKGIGAACAEEFAKKGAHVIINYNKSKNEAETLAKTIGAKAICADVSDSNSVDNMYRTLKASGIHIDCIVNNAGISSDKLFTDITEEEWDKMFSVNTKGTFLVTKAFLPDMIHNKSGNIINISSIWGEIGAAAEVHYSASKAAVIGMTKALAKELAPSGIRVNCICPGYIKTDMTSCYSESEVSAICEDIPLGRIGTACEIAKAAAFLASDDAAYITGQILGINGGWNI